MTEVTFDHLDRLHLLWGVLAVVALAVFGRWRRRVVLRRFADAHLLPRLATPVGWFRPLARLTLVALALLLLTAALLEPRWGKTEETISQRSIDMMILLDTSRSMLARDLVPNRLERAKLAIRDDLLPTLGGDRIGLMAFSGSASLVCPLTSDYGFFRLAIDDVTTATVPRGGTQVGDAIRRAADAFNSPLDTNRIILLITDGEDHQSYPVAAAAGLWEDDQIPIVTICLGDQREGARIPLENTRGNRYLQHDGQVVWTRAEPETLAAVAQAAGGDLFQAAGRTNAINPGTRNFDLGAIYQDIILPTLNYDDRQQTEAVQRPARLHVFALPALALLLLDSFLRDGGRRPATSATAARREKAA